jgi:hypothetical protein
MAFIPRRFVVSSMISLVVRVRGSISKEWGFSEEFDLFLNDSFFRSNSKGLGGSSY